MLLWVVGGGGFHDNCDLGSQEVLPSLRTFTYGAERTLDQPRRRSRQGTSPWLVVVGPFEEEEEGTRITNDVLKVKGEDLDTSGYLRGDRVRRDVGDLGSLDASLGSLTM